MYCYAYKSHTLCSPVPLPYREREGLPETGEILWALDRPPLSGRDTFPVTDPAQLTEREGVASLCTAPGPESLPRELTNAIRAGRVRAVNLAHPRFEELTAPLPRPEKVRVNLLALGDVGSTLLMGLRLMGGDVISSIGICDLREGVAQRWEFELNQIQLPGPYDALPPVEIVSPEQLFDGDVFLFCASRMIPDTSVTAGDVRMAQYQVNRELMSLGAIGCKFLHCLPATRGEDVTDEVADSASSLCWEQAGNRLTAMRGLLVYFTRCRRVPTELELAAAQEELDTFLDARLGGC